MSQIIYLDYAATTPVDPLVLEAMLPFLKENFGNASAIYSLGALSQDAIQHAREQVADLLSAADPEEIVFTSGGTEADNWAMRGIACANRERGKHIITTPIEHHAITEPAHWLKRDGFEVTYLPVDSEGLVDPDDLRKAMRSDTILVSVMHANNEIGVIQPIKELAKIAHEYDAYFHTDAVQTVGKIPVDVQNLGVDLLSISGHKLYAPKGVGALYMKRGTRAFPFLIGGGQEKMRRGGTYNVPGIVALGKACELAIDYLPTEQPRQQALRDRLIENVLNNIPDSKLNGHRDQRLPHNTNFSFKDVEGESLILNMDMMGICCSAGAACSSGDVLPSHVLTAIGLGKEWVQGAVRMTVGRGTIEAEIEQASSVLASAVDQVRRLRTS